MRYGIRRYIWCINSIHPAARSGAPSVLTNPGASDHHHHHHSSPSAVPALAPMPPSLSFSLFVSLQSFMFSTKLNLISGLTDQQCGQQITRPGHYLISAAYRYYRYHWDRYLCTDTHIGTLISFPTILKYIISMSLFSDLAQSILQKKYC